jgi:hypothetical protein
MLCSASEKLSAEKEESVFLFGEYLFHNLCLCFAIIAALNLLILKPICELKDECHLTACTMPLHRLKNTRDRFVGALVNYLQKRIFFTNVH